MTKRDVPTTMEQLDGLIHAIRSQRVMLSDDLAGIYGVETRVLNQAVKRNIKKFPSDFMFQLTRKEAEQLRHSRSQPVILKRGHNIKYLPYAFTEHGAIMDAGRSPNTDINHAFVSQIELSPWLPEQGRPECSPREWG